MTGPAPALQCRSLVKRYGDLIALDHLDLVVPAAEVHALVGFNGAGKSTLMRVILGMTHADTGEVTILGSDLVRGEADWSRVGHLVDSPFGYPELTVIENLYAAARLHGLSHRPAQQATGRAIQRLALEPWARRTAGTLSQGNRQRLGLAASVLHRPALLVLDEPTNALDPSGVVLLRDLVAELSADGTAVLVSSHHLDEVARVANRVSVVHTGRVIGELDPTTPDLERTFFAMVHEADTEDVA
ncbi:ABC-2 type transport system ATP-binding protein [Pedococcus dokdonensis]|uniref:ABC-2 type transport system ATP-binding protein n=1 Tax=Pedococcus dokdonensis TaxID=443156 RepID=A0A1H0SHU0_9MICO|nr:ATP-binding cassette domain-containing protein [Pedococcus dokdonensis]SDP40788.1 ABC-2 type transport system ATP-binding protein [Pedococcus dokdonensis]